MSYDELRLSGSVPLIVAHETSGGYLLILDMDRLRIVHNSALIPKVMVLCTKRDSKAWVRALGRYRIIDVSD